MTSQTKKRMPADIASRLLFVFFFVYSTAFIVIILDNVSGLFESRQPLIAEKLALHPVVAQLKKAGVVRISRGHAGLTNSSQYLAVKLTNGIIFTFNEYADYRRFVLTLENDTLSFYGATPETTKPLIDYLTPVTADLQSVLSFMEKRTQQEAVARASWHEPTPAAHISPR